MLRFVPMVEFALKQSGLEPSKALTGIRIINLSGVIACLKAAPIIRRQEHLTQRKIDMRFYQISIGAPFNTAPIETLTGYVSRQFIKSSANFARENSKRVRFHALTPVYLKGTK